MKTLLWQILLISCITYSYGQAPFECNGRSYRVLASNDGTFLQGIEQNESDESISFVNLHFYQDYEINAIAYHPTQNVIYGILQTPPYRLCRIDADYELEILQTLPLNTDLVFVSGDISPDEQHLVVFGFGESNTENIVALIDLQNGAYDTEVLSLLTSNPEQPFIYCADIAFHPTTGKLFGFDFKNGRLVMLDILNRIIDNETYPISGIVLGNVPSVFFNDRGGLFGIGTNLQEETENRGYYEFNLETGQPKLLQELEIEKNQDACSCPYRIKILNEVQPRRNSPCTEIVFEITLINRTLSDQVELTLSDTFPQGLTIERINSFPLSGRVLEGVGSNILNIKEMYLPIGVFSFEVILRIEENTTLGDFENQVLLSGIRVEDLAFDSVLSDDPLTAIPNDATKYSIGALKSTIDDQFFGICEGGETSIHAGIYGANSYQWSTGDSGEEILVDEQGAYSVTVTTDCDQTVATATVILDEIDLELGEDKSLEAGETIVNEPIYQSHSPIASFKWETDKLQTIYCPNCKDLVLKALSNTEVGLTIVNRTGCKSNDQLALNVVDLKIYAPNVFKPNSEGINSSFFLQGNLSYDIASFKIYDRWGNQMFVNKNFMSNLPEYGWDGTHNGQACNLGVYVWTALIRLKNGNKKRIVGDITLLR